MSLGLFKVFKTYHKTYSKHEIPNILIKPTGKCTKCGTDFGLHKTERSVQTECNSCKKKSNLCGKCKAQGCYCGGRFQNTFDKFRDVIH
jgi:hypothetical protein